MQRYRRNLQDMSGKNNTSTGCTSCHALQSKATSQPSKRTPKLHCRSCHGKKKDNILVLVDTNDSQLFTELYQICFDPLHCRIRNCELFIDIAIGL